MKSFDSRTYSVADFLEWHNNGLLELSPDFQRRPVWSQSAKSYLIDTIMRGKPIPKILIAQKLLGSRQLREVVDGQQRLRSILDFINGDFKISRAHNKDFAGYTYDMLSDKTKNEFLKYGLGVDVLFGMSYGDMLDIFARINTYTVSLNQQELKNAKYLGYFKQAVYNYGYRYVEYFLEGGILTKRQVSRMGEAELSAELFISLIGGVQTNKNTEQYYKKYEEKIGNLEEASKKFDNVMSYIGSIYPPEEIKETIWSRVHLFYTLFSVVGHLLYGLKGLNSTCRGVITKKNVGKIRLLLNDISVKYDELTKENDLSKIPEDYNKFIDFSRRRTTDTAARVGRANFVCGKIRSEIN